MFIHLRDFLQAITDSALQTSDDGAILLTLCFKPGFGILQSFSAFSQLLLDLQVFFVKCQIFFAEPRSISGIFNNLLGFGK